MQELIQASLIIVIVVVIVHFSRIVCNSDNSNKNNYDCDNNYDNNENYHLLFLMRILISKSL